MNNYNISLRIDNKELFFIVELVEFREGQTVRDRYSGRIHPAYTDPGNAEIIVHKIYYRDEDLNPVVINGSAKDNLITRYYSTLSNMVYDRVIEELDEHTGHIIPGR